MMRGVYGAVAMVAAAMIVCCSADAQQGQGSSVHSSAEQYDASGHKTRNLDPLGGGHLIRQIRDTKQLSGIHRAVPWLFGNHLKRNFDEIDRSQLNPFIGKRNFDEIDRSELNPFAGKRNFDEIDRSDINPFVGKRNFDEIDRSEINPFTRKRNFDEIDRSEINPFVGKRNFDEIDRSDINPFVGKRNFDEIDRSELNSFVPHGSDRYYSAAQSRKRRRLYRQAKQLAREPWFTAAQDQDDAIDAILSNLEKNSGT